MPPNDCLNVVLTKVECQNRIIEAIVDTEAEISVISPETCKLLKLPVTPKWEGPFLIMANGSQAHPEGTVDLKLLVENTSICIDAAILPINGFDLILGNNALRQLQTISITYSREGRTIFASKPEIEPRKHKGEFVPIANRESRTIAAISHILISGSTRESFRDNSTLWK